MFNELISTKNLFNSVSKGMNLKPNKEWKYHVALDTLSENREHYVAGILYNIGDQVIIKETNELVTVAGRGPNYIVIEKDDMKKRVWLDAVDPHISEDNDPAVLGDYGTDRSVKKMKAMTPGQGLMKFEAEKPKVMSNVDKVKIRQKRQDFKQDVKQDRAMDTARLRDVLKKNRETKVKRMTK